MTLAGKIATFVAIVVAVALAKPACSKLMRTLGVGLLLATVFANPSAACGTERWSVKVLSDPASAQLSLAPRRTTVAAFNATPRHQVGPGTPRIAGLETTLWDVRATVCLLKHERDEDLHVVVADSPAGCQKQGGRFVGPTAIAESPSASCAAPSRFRTALRTARKAVEQWQPGDQVHIRAAGFQDFDHGQTGHARNGQELHPILWVLP